MSILKTFSVLLLTPGGVPLGEHTTMLRMVRTPDVETAIRFARQRAMHLTDKGFATRPADWFVLLACEGEIKDINPETPRPITFIHHGG